MTHPGALISAVAWAATLALAARMGNAPGTMGLGVVAFLGAWAVTMTAMMLPTVSTESSAVVEASDTGRGTGTSSSFPLLPGCLGRNGALGVWLAAGAGSLAAKHGAAASRAAAVILAACGLYQLSSIKRGFLMRCRDASKHARQVFAGARWPRKGRCRPRCIVRRLQLGADGADRCVRRHERLRDGGCCGSHLR